MIVQMRQLVYDLLAGAPAPLYRWLPGSAEELPCYVVGRPGLTEGDSRAILAVSVPVFVLGRTVRDDDSQHQLDGLADALVKRLWTPPPLEGVGLRLTDLEATVTEVGGTDCPSYTATVICETTYC